MGKLLFGGNDTKEMFITNAKKLDYLNNIS